MPGLCHSNELISRDEGLHTNFACLLHSHLTTQMSATTIRTLIREAVELEQGFFAGTCIPYIHLVSLLTLPQKPSLSDYPA